MMGPDLALRTAMDFFKARQPLAAAIIYAELAQSGVSSPELWCGLGSCLMKSRGVLVRKPFEDWAAKIFRRGAPVLAGTPYQGPVAEWLRELPAASSTPPLGDNEIAEMIEFLLVNERVFPDAAAALSPDDAMSAVMMLGDRKNPIYIPLLREAIEGRLGDGAARSALKRIGSFIGRPDIQASLLAASKSPMREELGPYLSFVVDRLPAGWDGPRASACPPYEGIGRIDIELISAGPKKDEVARAICERLIAAERDARSWVDNTPCIIKKGAMRDDAIRLASAIEPLGAEVKMHGFTWSFEDKPGSRATGSAGAADSGTNSRTNSNTKKPWWKFW